MADYGDKYSKYDFSEDDEEEAIESKSKSGKSVDISELEEDTLSEEELEAERKKVQEAFEEKKRRIIEGTNFDNSLRKK